MIPEIKKFTNRDNLEIAYREYGAYQPDKPTILCLAGLTRNSKSFDDYASYLCRQWGVHVIAPDMRGRGLSEHDSLWPRYNIVSEAQDFIELIQNNAIDNVVIIGTSRGGMQSAVMAGEIKEKIKAVILNDIGTTVPIDALQRLSRLFQKDDRYVGTYDDALSAFYDIDNGMTKNLTPQQEYSIIHSIYKKEENGYWLDYDLEGLGLSHEATIKQINFSESYKDMQDISVFLLHSVQSAFLKGLQPTHKSAVKEMNCADDDILDLSHFFSNLKDIPLLLLHGISSDILTLKDIKKTQELLPQTQVASFKDRGHTLYFNEPELIEICNQFLSNFIKNKAFHLK